MSNFIDQSLNALIHGNVELNNDIDFNLSPLSAELLERCSNVSVTNIDFEDLFSPLLTSSNTNMESSAGYTPDHNSDQQDLSNSVSQSACLINNVQINCTQIQIIAQPYYGTKLRYRSDYEKNENRLGVLKNRNKESSYQGPAIRIPPDYLNPNGEFFVRVTLVTAEIAESLHYFHPYELEHPLNEQMNERATNSVWVPIQAEDCITGIKSFSSLRIVKKTASELKTSGPLHVFDCHDPNMQNHILQQMASAKDTINKYNLEKSQLAFSIGQKNMNTNNIVIYPDTTVYSEEMIEGVNKEVEGENSILSPNDKPIPSPSDCRVYKYAPRYGFGESEEDMVIFLTSKLEPRKYGELKVTFISNTSNNSWSVQVPEVDVKDRMISFKTPIYQGSFDMVIPVDIVLQQDNRDIGTIKYYYLSTLNSCSNCQSNAVRIQTNAVPNVPNKRPAEMIFSDFQNDSFVAQCGESSTIQKSLSEPGKDSVVPSSTISTSNKASSQSSVNQTQTNTNSYDQLMNTLSNSIKSLFIDNDYNTFFRICRSFLRKSPNILHTAIINNNVDVLSKFIPVSSMEFLQQKNQSGETVLLHALRLNRLKIVKILLENENSKTLIKDTDEKNNNIFHIIALNSISLDMMKLLYNYLTKDSINIQEHFDKMNQDKLRPIQLSITKNNLSITKIFCKFFDKNIYQTKDYTGDNLIHLAIKYADLNMIKYLIEDENLFEQGKECNFKMKPIDLAKSLKRQDIIEYLQKIYPQDNIEENQSSDDDDD